MLSRIHDVPVDMRSSHEAEAEDDTFNMVIYWGLLCCEYSMISEI